MTRRMPDPGHVPCSYRTLPRQLLALLAASLAASVQALPFNLGAVEGQLDSELGLSTYWALQQADRELIGRANGGAAPAASGDDGRRRFARGAVFSQRFTARHALELRSADSGLLLSGRYWYDFALQDDSRLAGDRGAVEPPRGEPAGGAQLLEAFVYRQQRIAGQPGSLRLGRQLLGWGEGRLIPGGIDVINPFDSANWRAPRAGLREGRLPVNLLHGAQAISDALSVEGFYQLEWRPDAAQHCSSFLADADYLGAGCRHLAQPAAAPLPRLAEHAAADRGQFGLALRYAVDPLDSEFSAFILNYHSRQPLLGLSTDGYVLVYPEDIRLYGLGFATTLPAGSRWRGEFSYRPNAPLQPSIAEGLASARPQAAYRRTASSQLQTSLSQRFDQVMGASQLELLGELAWIHVARPDGRHGRNPLFGPGPQAGGCAGTATRYCSDDGFTSRNAWGYRLQAHWTYRRAFAGLGLAGLDLRPSLSWAHDVDGHSPAPEAVFVAGRKTLGLGLRADYHDTYHASLDYTGFFGGRYSTHSDRDFLSLELGVRF